MCRTTRTVFLLALFIAAMWPVLPSIAAESGCGDLNGSGSVNVADATLALRIAVGSLQPTGAQPRVGDVNKDGRINVLDATLILRAAVGLANLEGTCTPPEPQEPSLTTVVGEPNAMANGSLAAARFQLPSSLSFDSKGNLIVADLNNHAIRQITPDGQVSTIAGNGVAGFKDGPIGEALLGDIWFIEVGSDDTIYFSDVSNLRIRMIPPDRSKVETLAGNPELDQFGFAIPDHRDGPGTEARFFLPFGLAVDGSNNVFVADTDDNTIRKIDTNRNVTTVAGSGTWGDSDGDGDPLLAAFRNPVGLALGDNGDLYISDFGNEKIRIYSATGEVFSFAGAPPLAGDIPQPAFKDGPANVAQFGSPRGIDFHNGTLYVADSDFIDPEINADSFYNGRIRAVSPSGDVSTLAGSDRVGDDDGKGSEASFRLPNDIAAAPDGNLYVADFRNDSIRKVAPDGTVTTLAGRTPYGYEDGPGPQARLLGPQFISGDGKGNFYIADYGNNRIRLLSSAGVVSTVIGQDLVGGVGGYQDGPVKAAQVDGPTSVAVASDGTVYFTDRENHSIRRIGTDGNVTTLAGTGQAGFKDGPRETAQFNRPRHIAFAPDGTLVVADTLNHRIRRIALDGEVTTIAGGGTGPEFKNGPAADARFAHPQAVAIAADGTIYVSEFDTHMIRKIDPAGNVTTLAGNPPVDENQVPIGGYQDGTATEAMFDTPGGLLLLPDGNLLVADRFNNRIRKVTPTGDVTTVAGLWDSGFWDGPLNIARLDGPIGLALDSDGSVLVSEEYNHRIRRLRL